MQNFTFLRGLGALFGEKKDNFLRFFRKCRKTREALLKTNPERDTRSKPVLKSLKVPSLECSVPKPLKVPSLERSVPMALKCLVFHVLCPCLSQSSL